MPATRDDLILMLGNDDAGQRHCQIALQIGEDEFVIVAAGE